jgi:hypothetical protein
MEQSANNFNELNTDMHPYNTKPGVMTDALNAALTTRGDNQFILQNMQGNQLATQLTTGFQPIGIAVHKNIAYIISARYDAAGVFLEGEIGTYPSPDWATLLTPALSPTTATTFVPMLNQYSPIKNFLTNTQLAALMSSIPATENAVLNNDAYYEEAFKTPLLDFPNDRLIEVEIQQSYDNSVNILFTDNRNQKRLVNSRFILSEDGKSAALADRRQSKDTNTYSEKRFSATKLIRNFEKIPRLRFGSTASWTAGDNHGVRNGGELPGGNYKVYFKYTDSDGSETDVFEESGVVALGVSNIGTAIGQNSGKYIEFELTNLDRRFSGIKVFYSYATGDVEATTTVHEILNPYDIPDSDPVIIKIYGNELIQDVPRSKLNLDFSSITAVKTFTQHDDRLVDGNIDNSNVDFTSLALIANALFVEETDILIDADYSKPDLVYNYLGHWAGETYEIGIVYVLTRGRGVSPVFPVIGRDNLNGVGSYTGGLSASQYTNGFYTPSAIAQNNVGAYRTAKARTMLAGTRPPSYYTNGDISQPVDDGLSTCGSSTYTRGLRINVNVLLNTSIVMPSLDSFVTDNIEGWFFVRKERKKDCIMQGWATNTAIVSVDQYFRRTSPYYYNFAALDNLTGTPAAEGSYKDFSAVSNRISTISIGIDQQEAHTKGKIIPAPGRMMELAFETNTDDSRTFKTLLLQGKVSPNPTSSSKTVADALSGSVSGLPTSDPCPTYFAFYSPDALVNPKLAASMFKGDQKGFLINSTSVQVKGFVGDFYTEVGPSASFFNEKVVSVLYPVNFSHNMDRPTNYATNPVNSYFTYIHEYQDAFVNGQFSAVSQNNHFVSYGTPSCNLAVDSLRFGDYIGIKNVGIDSTKLGTIPQFVSNLQNDASTLVHGLPSDGAAANDPDCLIGRMQTISPGVRFAMPMNVYNSVDGIIPYVSDNWKNKYANVNNTEPYFAVTRRISLSDARAGAQAEVGIAAVWPYQNLFGGDCFISYTFKRLWYPSGIDENPAAQDPYAYRENNRDTNIVERGVVVALVCESNYNSALRSLETVSDPIEQGIYGNGRTFHPLVEGQTLKKSRQLESKGYNHGYDFTSSDRDGFALNSRAPAFNLAYDTRVMVSNVSVSGSFKNGYADFSGLNYKDYAKNLGPITKLISHNGTLFCVQENGISVVPMQQKTMISSEQNGIFVDDAKLLGDKLQFISTEFGSNQQFSIVKTPRGVYGCDLIRNKIWLIETADSKHSLKIISDFSIQKLLNEYKEKFTFSGDGSVPLVKANYDQARNSVIFTYYNVYRGKLTTDLVIAVNSRAARIATVYMDENIGKWVSQLSFNPVFTFNIGNDLYSFNAEVDQHKIWKHYAAQFYTDFYGTQHNFEFEFVLVDRPDMQKLLNNFKVVCNRVFPNRISYTIDADIHLETGVSNNPSHTQLVRQRHEGMDTTILGGVNNGGRFYIQFSFLDLQELERLTGAYFQHLGVYYVFGNPAFLGGGLYIEILDQNLNIIAGIPSFGTLNITQIHFGVIKQNAEYVEDILYIEVGKEPQNSRIRDKAVKVRFNYNGKERVMIQQIISIFDYSYS